MSDMPRPSDTLADERAYRIRQRMRAPAGFEPLRWLTHRIIASVWFIVLWLGLFLLVHIVVARTLSEPSEYENAVWWIDRAFALWFRTVLPATPLALIFMPFEDINLPSRQFLTAFLAHLWLVFLPIAVLVQLPPLPLPFTIYIAATATLAAAVFGLPCVTFINLVLLRISATLAFLLADRPRHARETLLIVLVAVLLYTGSYIALRSTGVLDFESRTRFDYPFTTRDTYLESRPRFLAHVYQLAAETEQTAMGRDILLDQIDAQNK